MRAIRVVLPLALVAALAASPSLAADQTVRATPSNTFSPSTVTVNVGDTVTFTNDGGFHNVKFEDGAFEEPSEPSFSSWTVKRTFTAPGQFRYFCEQHGSAGGGGMAGTVVVQGGDGPPPTDTTAPDIDSARESPATFCTKKTSKCPKTGARLRFTIDEDADVAGVIVRRSDGKQVGKTLAFDARAGKNSFKFSGKGLARGKYRIELTATDAAGNVAPTVRVSFKIASKR